MDSIIQILRNQTLYDTYETAKTKLSELLSGKRDGEIALATYGTSWDNAQTIFGFVRTVGDKKSYTIYAPFKNSDIALGKGLGYDGDGKLEVKTDDKAIVIDTDSKISLKISNTDKVLSQNENGLISTISLAYGSHSDGTEGKKSIKLYGKDTTIPISEIDATDFIKDGMLSNAELVTKKEEGVETEVPYIKLTFNTDAESKIVRFSVKDLVDVYTQGNGITISDKVVSVKVSNDTEPYLSVAEKGVAIKGVDAAISTAVGQILKDYEKTTYADPFEGKIAEAKLHVSDNDTVKAATKKLEGTISKLVNEVLENEQTVAIGINDMANAAGVVDGGGKIGYVTETDTNYIKTATSVHNATVILDKNLKNLKDTIDKAISDNVIDGGTY